MKHGFTGRHPTRDHCDDATELGDLEENRA